MPLNDIETAMDLSSKFKQEQIKKRKSTRIFSCFGNKKVKASTEQHGQTTLSNIDNNHIQQTTTTTTTTQEKPKVDHGILSDGKRIYIDIFRDRLGYDMSYKPNNFDTQFVVPIVRRYNLHRFTFNAYSVLFFCFYYP